MNNFKNDNKKQNVEKILKLKTIIENVCINCGQVDRYEIVNEFIDFHENRHKIYSENQFTIESITFVIQLAVSAVRITYR